MREYMAKFVAMKIKRRDRHHSASLAQQKISHSALNVCEQFVHTTAFCTIVSESCPVAGSITDEWRHLIDKSRQYNLARLACRLNWATIIINDFDYARLRPMVECIGIFTV